MNLIIDSREKERIPAAQEYYEKQGLTTNVKELPIGDYIFQNENDEKVCFEFKTIPDFISSIQSHRVFNQAINMAENFNYHYVLIQGNEAERTKNLAISRNLARTHKGQQITVYQYLGAIASLNRYTTVIESYSPTLEESFYRMLITARKCLQNKPIVKKFQKKHKNPCFNWLCYCNYGISSKKANNIVETLNLHNLADLQKITIDDLTSIDGIGTKTAENIIKMIV